MALTIFRYMQCGSLLSKSVSIRLTVKEVRLFHCIKGALISFTNFALFSTSIKDEGSSCWNKPAHSLRKTGLQIVILYS